MSFHTLKGFKIHQALFYLYFLEGHRSWHEFFWGGYFTGKFLVAGALSFQPARPPFHMYFLKVITLPVLTLSTL